MTVLLLLLIYGLMYGALLTVVLIVTAVAIGWIYLATTPSRFELVTTYHSCVGMAMGWPSTTKISAYQWRWLAVLIATIQPRCSPFGVWSYEVRRRSI